MNLTKYTNKDLAILALTLRYIPNNGIHIGQMIRADVLDAIAGSADFVPQLVAKESGVSKQNVFTAYKDNIKVNNLTIRDAFKIQKHFLQAINKDGSWVPRDWRNRFKKEIRLVLNMYNLRHDGFKKLCNRISIKSNQFTKIAKGREPLISLPFGVGIKLENYFFYHPDEIVSDLPSNNELRKQGINCVSVFKELGLDSDKKYTKREYPQYMICP